MIYTKNGSYPAELPFRILMPDGSTRTDQSTFTDDEIAAAGYVVADPKPEADVVDWVDGAWVSREFTAEENALHVLQKENAIRGKRNERLAETDWWAVQDRTMSQAEKDYRQALRDITDQPTFPDSVVWPTEV